MYNKIKINFHKKSGKLNYSITFGGITIRTKEALVAIFKNAILFAFMATAVFLTISVFTYYVFIVNIGTEFEITAMIAGTISSIIIVILNFKYSIFTKKIRQQI
ncbi:MAG: hypothetical protein U9P70_04385 [Patescibacteria group bacterium]|nr:hypothetical protein [Patescibacteria group bacterium]